MNTTETGSSTPLSPILPLPDTRLPDPAVDAGRELVALAAATATAAAPVGARTLSDATRDVLATLTPEQMTETVVALVSELRDQMLTAHTYRLEATPF
ncbi:hypothetical protein [Microbacterium sp.]|uniref:hypothetical protein n=1 Tax=Microbacterium sp. TaxID=51671 RepID=UPI00262298A4|nr:hypothetical protein [Microbacterium sp.]